MIFIGFMLGIIFLIQIILIYAYETMRKKVNDIIDKLSNE